MKLLLQWLYPGLNIKRWMLLFSFGLMLLAFGAALVMNYQVFGRIEEEILRLLFVLTGTYSYTFLAAAGIFFVFIGLFFMLWAIRRLVKRFLQPCGTGSGKRVPPYRVEMGIVPRAESRGYRRRTRIVHASPRIENKDFQYFRYCYGGG